MVVFDATILLPLLWPDCPPPRHPETNEPIPDFKVRIEYLVSRLSRTRTKIIVPTPALSEVLVRAGQAGEEYLRILNSTGPFRPASFDQRAAMELAIIMGESLSDGEKRARGDQTWAKFKFDRQIIAIARTENASTIYSDDKPLCKLGQRLGISVVPISELPMPPQKAQLELEDWANQRQPPEQNGSDEVFVSEDDC